MDDEQYFGLKVILLYGSPMFCLLRISVKLPASKSKHKSQGHRKAYGFESIISITGREHKYEKRKILPEIQIELVNK